MMSGGWGKDTPATYRLLHPELKLPWILSEWSAEQQQGYVKWNDELNPPAAPNVSADKTILNSEAYNDWETVSSEWDGRSQVDEILAEHFSDNTSIADTDFLSNTSASSGFTAEPDSQSLPSLTEESDLRPWYQRVGNKPMDLTAIQEGESLDSERFNIAAGERFQYFNTKGPQPYTGSFDELGAVPELPPEIASSLDFQQLTDTERILMYETMENARIGQSMTGELFDINKFTTGLLTGQVMGFGMSKLLGWIQKQGYAGKKFVDTFNIAMPVLNAMAGNPVTALVGVSTLQMIKYREAVANRRKNNFSGDISDTKFGWVQDEGVWYPAVIRNFEHGEGPKEGGVSYNRAKFVYGRPEDFYFTEDGTGKIRGEFRHHKIKEFRVSDEDWRKRQDYDTMNKEDPYRGYYFMSDAEADDMLSKWNTPEFEWSSRPRDTSDFTPFMKFEYDFQKSLDLMQNTKNTLSDDSLYQVPANRGFKYESNQVTFWESGNSSLGIDPKKIRTGSNGMLPTDEWGLGSNFDDEPNSMFSHKPHQPQWQHVVTDYLTRELEDLYRTRDLAVRGTGVDARYWTDSKYKFPPAENYDSLKTQFQTIEGLKDRNRNQKDFLLNKVGTRYMMKQISDAGYSRTMFDMLYKKKDNEEGFNSVLGYLPGITKKKYKEDSVYSTETQTGLGIPAWVDPGEAAIPKWVELTDGRRLQETNSSKYIMDELDRYKLQNGFYPDEQFSLSSEIVKPEIIQPLKTGKRWMNVVKRLPGPSPDKVKGRKAKLRMERIMETHRGDGKDISGEDWRRVHDPDYDVDMTWERFLDLANDPMISLPNMLGEASNAHIANNILRGNYHWARGRTLSHENIPASFVRDDRDLMKSMLDDLPPQLRQSADYLHDIANEQQTTHYLATYHTKQNVLAHDEDTGAVELKNDWGLPWEQGINKVQFNGHIHRQMNFNSSEV